MKTMKAVGVLVIAGVVLAAIGGCKSKEPAKQLTLDLGNKVTMTVMLIPSGKFTMGSPKDGKVHYRNEGPQHEVTISRPFYMGIYTVTQEQYEQIMGKNPSNFKGEQNPVEQVSWDDAVEFCKALSKKTGMAVSLPTEAQWEYACRAASATLFSYGDDYDKLSDYAWYYTNSNGRTHTVGQLKPNEWGLYDMHGNVLQWCSDWYADTYANGDISDPQGPGSGTERVLRGGHWFSLLPEYCRSTIRPHSTPDSRTFCIGFRVSIDLK